MKVASKKPKKQRKALFNYKNHQRSKLLSTRLADFLQDVYGVRRLPIRVGDNVRVVKGDFKDIEGECMEVRKDLKLIIKECKLDKTSGESYYVPIHHSKVIITKLKKEGKKMDNSRKSILERKTGYEFIDEELKGPIKK